MVFGGSDLLAGFSSQTDGQRDRPVNGSQQRLCKLLMLNEKGQRVAKRVGHAPSVTLRVMCRTKTSICTAESDEFPGIRTEREEQNLFYLYKDTLMGVGAFVRYSRERVACKRSAGHHR